jgi:4-hydroxymandelate oxidase
MGRDLSDAAISLADFEALARERLDPATWAYLDGGAGDETTQRANRAAWQALRLLPRVLRATAGGHTRVDLFGRTLQAPLLVAPMAWQTLFHPHAECGMAMAAAALGCGLVLSAQSATPVEDVAAAMRAEPQRGPLWFQLAPGGDAARDAALLQRAQAAGCAAIVLTVDAPVHGARDRERRAGFRIPAALRPAHFAAHPEPSQGAGLCGGLGDAAPGWAQLARLREAVALPVLLKGVLHPDDAREAQRHGFAGVIVSNHGGRTLDGVVPTAWALPRVRDALGLGATVLVDGGIRRGSDVLAALALGADAVLVGRPLACALAAASAPGAARALRLLRDELEIALLLAGCANPSSVPRALVVGTHE